MDTFFCGASFPAFSRRFPGAAAYRLLTLSGKSSNQKAVVLQQVCRALRADAQPFFRIVKSNLPTQTAGLVLPGKKVMLLDRDYFAGIAENYPRAADFSFSADTPALARLSEAELQALAEYDALLAQASRRADSFQEAAAALQAENMRLLSPCVHKAAVLHFLLGFLQKKSTRCVQRQPASAQCLHAEISGITGWGVQTLYTPFHARGMETIVLKDNIGAVSETLLNGLAEACVQSGLSVQVFHCGLTGAAEHCVIPALSAAFFTENLSHPFPLRAKAVLSASRFVRLSAFAEVLPEVRFNAAAADEMLDEAVFSRLEADELAAAREHILQSCCDEQAAGALCKQICNRLSTEHGQIDENKI